MDYEKMADDNGVNFEGINSPEFLLGILSAFDNRYQAAADKFFGEISWKQFFAIICINMCKEAPTINQLSEIMGSSHQNVKQILNKLEKKDFIETKIDEKDKRKQRIYLTEKTRTFCEKNAQGSDMFMKELYKGISEENIRITIETIAMMEQNLKKL